ncbi:hypothetical protein [Massilia sp. METH4]|uniref:hypothetical protein n=1 Tax=Massilia sp. METH4 TaxID=3123041 RepID=UPI0030CD0CB7
MHYFVKSALGAAVALSLSTSAMAEVRTSAFASLSDIKFSVQDLTPSDGRVPGFVFGERLTLYSVFNDANEHNDIVLEPTSPTPVNFLLDYAPGASALQSDGKLGSYTSSVTANTGNGRWDTFYNLSSGGWDSQKIVLKAQSVLTVSGLASGSVSRFVPSTTADRYTENEMLHSTVSVNLTYGSGSGPGQSFYQSLALGEFETHEAFNNEFSLLL